MVEVLVASVVLLVGIVGTLTLVQMAGGAANRAKSREGATNLARELLETARDLNYSTVGTTNWFTSTLQNLPGRTGNVTSPIAGTLQVLAARRGTTYTITSKTCSVDDSKDGYGTHGSSATWCSDSSGTGTADSQPEDMKRVTIDVNYSTRGVQQPTIEQVATFSAGGAAVGPQTSNLVMATPTPVPAAAPVITTNPVSGNATFLGTSAGAADMKFTVNGVEQASGVVNNNNGTWTFTWPVSTLKDATYTIGAAAVDALGVRGPSRTMTVKLARGAPVTPTNVVGGFNYVNVGGVKTLVVEGQWDANPEGSVTGYEVLRGATSVCGSATSLAITCIDFNPVSSGSSTYTFKTWYRDGAGNLQAVSTNYTVTAPVAATTVPTLYGWMNTTTQIAYTPGCGTSGSGLGVFPVKRDIVANFTTSGGTDTTAGAGSPAGCGPQLPAGTTMAAGTATFSAWMTNTGNSACSNTWFLYHNNTNFGGSGVISVPAHTTTATKFTATVAYPVQTIVANDRISMYVNVCSNGTMVYGSGAHQTTLSLPTLSGGSAGTPIPTPTMPTGLTGSATGGVTTLTWTAPATSNPAVDFYRIYRDGSNYANRIDSTDATASTTSSATAANATTLPVVSATGFAVGQSIAVDTGASQDNVTISAISGNTLTVSAMAHSHASGVPVGLRTVTWVDNNTGGSTHTYYVTSASAALAESTMTAAVGPL